eukprot:359192-Chlamydomonas_euryale.AAC.3
MKGPKGRAWKEARRPNPLPQEGWDTQPMEPYLQGICSRGAGERWVGGAGERATDKPADQAHREDGERLGECS